MRRVALVVALAGRGGGGGQAAPSFSPTTGTPRTLRGEGVEAGGFAVITKLGGHAVADADDLASAISRSKPGATAGVEIHRGGETQVSKVNLDERPLGDPSAG